MSVNAWSMYKDDAHWFDCETLEAGPVHYEVEPNCDMKDVFARISASEEAVKLYGCVYGMPERAVYVF